jgi:hypothetical protein
VLVMGYDVAHPPPMNPQTRRMAQSVDIDLQSFDPSVVGVSISSLSAFISLTFQLIQIDYFR